MQVYILRKKDLTRTIKELKATLKANKDLMALAGPQLGYKDRVFCIKFADGEIKTGEGRICFGVRRDAFGVLLEEAHPEGNGNYHSICNPRPGGGNEHLRYDRRNEARCGTADR